MISLEHRYDITYDEILQIEKALKIIRNTKGLKVNLRSIKRTSIFYSYLKEQFNFHIIKKGHMSVFLTKETANKIKTFISPIIEEFKEKFSYDFRKGLDLINEIGKNDNSDLRIKYITDKVNQFYILNSVVELSMHDFDLIWCIKNLLSCISEKRFPIRISELDYPIKRSKLKKFLKMRLILFNIISESFSESSVDEILCKELYHLLIQNQEPNLRRYIVKKILDYDKRSFEMIYNERIPNNTKSNIKRIFVSNLKKKRDLTNSQAVKTYNSLISRESEFLNLMNNGYFSDLGNIITNTNNWNIFKADFSIFNVSKDKIKKEFGNINQVRNKIVHIIEEESGKFNILKELSELKILINNIADFCFGLAQIIEQPQTRKIKSV